MLAHEKYTPQTHSFSNTAAREFSFSLSPDIIIAASLCRNNHNHIHHIHIYSIGIYICLISFQTCRGCTRAPRVNDSDMCF